MSGPAYHIWKGVELAVSTFWPNYYQVIHRWHTHNQGREGRIEGQREGGRNEGREGGGGGMAETSELVQKDKTE